MAQTELPMATRKRIQVKGVVQGVGFRPFVYNLAQSLGLAGYILNSSEGVTVEIEGSEIAGEQFLDALRDRPPPLANITDMAVTTVACQGDLEFVIEKSLSADGAFVLVSPDVATCEDCWREFGDPANRRHGYPFTNCTNCGPRYTIVRDVPYDRAKTTMAEFRMCKLCRDEYENPADRRFHAQPNACPACGPQVVLRETGTQLPEARWFRGAKPALGELQRVRVLLREGRILAVKGLGGFLLACDAQNDAAVALLRQRKRRSDKPFAVMIRDLAAVESFCALTEADRVALQSRRRPIVILPRRDDAQISRDIAPGNNLIGVMLPYTPLHYLLFSDSPGEPPEFSALVMTSGNLSEEPIVTENEQAWQQLQSVADWFLFHNRDIYMRVDDSVVRTFHGRERTLRRARGYVPQPVDVGAPMQELLACGAELKNTFCLTKDRYAILSQHIGDLENYETLRFFEETLANLKKLFRVEPQAVAYDLHPNYMSSRYARALPLDRKIGVQHHHAHIASCMAENYLQGEVIGAAFDGTGYGSDGKIWGGEFLVATLASFERAAHFRYVPQPGGDAAVRQPWRMALSYLRDALGPGGLPEHLQLLQRVPAKEFSVVDAMIVRRIHAIDSSSCGRMFDAVAALVGLGERVSFEGQAAIALESAADVETESRYGFNIAPFDPMQIDMRQMTTEIVRDLSLGRETAYISACFHNTVAAVVMEVCERIRKQRGLGRVCLSGGVFQNMRLLDRTVRQLESGGFEVFLHSLVPPNDSGIALGQAVVANAVLRQ